MDAIFSFGQTLLSFLFILTVLVFVHEWGHYIVARLNGVRVDVFSVGFGPEIWGRTDKKGTRWKISAIPLGGYVKFFGDAGPASNPDGTQNEMTEEEKKVSFHHKRLSQKAAVVFAGPAINFLFAILIIAGLYFSYGRMELAPVVGDVVEGGAADVAGIKAGDRIVTIDGVEIETFMEIREHLMFKVVDDVSVEVMRGGDILALNFVLDIADDEDILGKKTKVRQIGIRSSTNPDDRVLKEYGIFSSLWEASITTKNLTIRNLQGLGQIVMGDRSTKELGGPITIARVAGRTAEYGFVSLINFMAMVSIGLGMINLFPIPMLDGGHLLYYAIEAVKRKKMSEEAQEFGFKIGALVVLSLMIFAFYNDLSHLFTS
ncbi:RIP metalloprotease RseP [Pseudemcibacter aquimaris]|uniref:RIP metalloprotease RseP n=1 Tax=Pseudemcibacter aquimaris TaxID=2857064 RepID=UPI00201101FF|nr:RIP metalloprotease RseP [Pseudemcibacter aquimaris]MCC3860888.1 RIP metalloprotease RseP [Pseudemcibacter aquimaris]WDU59706.1 RIP metalloprotease RseP [Pseudemcibacter aquimaris]